MSVAQMICHVRGAFLTAMSEGEPVYEQRPIPPIVLKRIALYAPVTWARNFPTMASLRIGAPTMETAEFSTDKAGLIDAFDRFCAKQNHTRDHAFFHAMNHADWMRWGYLHTDHHLRQFGR